MARGLRQHWYRVAYTIVAFILQIAVAFHLFCCSSKCRDKFRELGNVARLDLHMLTHTMSYNLCPLRRCSTNAAPPPPQSIKSITLIAPTEIWVEDTNFTPKYSDIKGVFGNRCCVNHAFFFNKKIIFRLMIDQSSTNTYVRNAYLIL